MKIMQYAPHSNARKGIMSSTCLTHWLLFGGRHYC